VTRPFFFSSPTSKRPFSVVAVSLKKKRVPGFIFTSTHSFMRTGAPK